MKSPAGIHIRRFMFAGHSGGIQSVGQLLDGSPQARLLRAASSIVANGNVGKQSKGSARIAKALGTSLIRISFAGGHE